MKYYARHKKRYYANKYLDKEPKTSLSYDNLYIVSYSKYKGFFDYK